MYYNPKPHYVRVKEMEDKLLLEIKKYAEKYNRPPSVRELQRLIGAKSTSTIHVYLKRLKEKGLVDWEPKQIRTLRII